MNILFIAIGVCVLGYLIYGWVDHFRSGRYKNISTETPNSPRLEDGRKPRLSEVNMDLSEKILNHDFDSNDNT